MESGLKIGDWLCHVSVAFRKTHRPIKTREQRN